MIQEGAARNDGLYGVCHGLCSDTGGAVISYGADRGITKAGTLPATLLSQLY